MKKSTLFTLVFLFLLYLSGQAQYSKRDSLTIDQKFERLQFQVDSLKKVSSDQAERIKNMNRPSLDDSLQKKIQKSEKEIMAIRHNLYKMNKQYRSANIVTFTGIAFTFIGYMMAIQADRGFYVSEPLYTGGIALGFSGAVMTSLIAPIIRIDANKFLKGAGKKYKVQSTK